MVSLQAKIWHAQFPRRANPTATIFTCVSVCMMLPTVVLWWRAQESVFDVPFGLLLVCQLLLNYSAINYMRTDRRVPGGVGTFWTMQTMFHTCLLLGVGHILSWIDVHSTSCWPAYMMLIWAAPAMLLALFGFYKDMRPAR